MGKKTERVNRVFGMSDKKQRELADVFYKADAATKTMSELAAKLGLKGAGDKAYLSFCFGRKTAAVDIEAALLRRLG